MDKSGSWLPTEGTGYYFWVLRLGSLQLIKSQLEKRKHEIYSKYEYKLQIEDNFNKFNPDICISQPALPLNLYLAQAVVHTQFKTDIIVLPSCCAHTYHRSIEDTCHDPWDKNYSPISGQLLTLSTHPSSSLITPTLTSRNLHLEFDPGHSY